MKNLFLALTAAILFTGCASTSDFNAMKDRVTALEGQVASAANAANDASAAAQSASRNASAAQSAAERALNAANEANERAKRMAETCCARK